MLEASEKWAKVSLRIWGEGLPLDEIEGRLGLKPDRLGRKGEPLGGHGLAKFQSDFWCWAVTAESSVPLERQLELALEVLWPARNAIGALLHEADAEADLFLGFSSANGQGGATFPVAVIKKLAELGIPLTLDLYPPERT
jgi:hypothetical protein